jgi:hypothetical protein
MTEISELKTTILKLREEKYPDLPAELIDEILSIEADWIDDKGQAFRRVAQAVDKYMTEQEGSQQ